MVWSDWIRNGGEVEPSRYAAKLMRLGEQIEALLAAGAAVFRFDVDVPIQVSGGVGETDARSLRQAAAGLLVEGSAIFGDADPAIAYRHLSAAQP